jgi:hypothetical protein
MCGKAHGILGEEDSRVEESDAGRLGEEHSIRILFFRECEYDMKYG